MKKEREFYLAEKERLNDRIDRIDRLLNAFQDVCDHKNEDGSDAMEFVGNDSHKNYYECTICGYGKSL